MTGASQGVPTGEPAPWRDLADLASALARGAQDCVALVERCLARIAALEPRLNAMTFVDADGARAAARRSHDRRRAGRSLSPFDGVPFVVKDNVFVRGLPVTWGSHGFADHVPVEDEIAVARLRARGLIPIGMTNTPEFAAQGYTGNVRYGVTRNPWDPTLTPGGTSGGSAVAVAAGYVPLAIGTDGGGSTRRPAGHTGLAGFKPSAGAVPRWPTFPSISLDFETIGLFARNVADVRAVFDLVRGPDARDRASRGVPRLALVERPARLYAFRGIEGRPVDPQVLAELDATAARFEAMGHKVTFGPQPFDPAALDEIYATIVAAGVAAVALALLDRDVAVGAPLADMARRGRAASAVDMTRAWHRVLDLRASLGTLFERFDAILSPAAAALPWPAEQVFPVSIGGQPAQPRDHAPYTRFANAGGNPGIVWRTGTSRSGLPLGSQLVGDFGADDLILDLAERFERRYPLDVSWP